MLSSSEKDECLRSPPVMSREAGVMCSATQCGLRVVRLKEETKEGAERTSLMGPGKPYWKRPAGSTGGIMGPGGPSRRGTGRGAGGVVRVPGGATVVVVAAIVWPGCSFLLPMPNRAAVVAAPTAAEAPATTAMVNLDMATGVAGIQAGIESLARNTCVQALL